MTVPSWPNAKRSLDAFALSALSAAGGRRFQGSMVLRFHP